MLQVTELFLFAIIVDRVGVVLRLYTSHPSIHTRRRCSEYLLKKSLLFRPLPIDRSININPSLLDSLNGNNIFRVSLRQRVLILSADDLP
jgi:hypothetical protein